MSKSCKSEKLTLDDVFFVKTFKKGEAICFSLWTHDEYKTNQLVAFLHKNNVSTCSSHGWLSVCVKKCLLIPPPHSQRNAFMHDKTTYD